MPALYGIWGDYSTIAECVAHMQCRVTDWQARLRIRPGQYVSDLFVWEYSNPPIRPFNLNVVAPYRFSSSVTLSGSASVRLCMPYTVAVSFDKFFDNINLNGDHRETANTRKDNVVSTLGKSFEIVEAFSTGSIPKFTALKQHADLDVMVALHYSKHIKDKTPTQVLQNVRDALAEWRTDVRRNGQAVTLYYKTWPNVDIVPVSRVVNDDGSVSYYNVPDSNTNTWIQSRPKSLAATIESDSSECGYNFRRIIKMIKHWNRIHSNYLRSYHIEVLAIKVLSGNLNDTPWHVFKFFENARNLLEDLLWYDTGFADEYLSWPDRQEVLKRFDTAIERSRNAWSKAYGENDDHKGAIEIWKQIFGTEFPSYGS